MVKDERKTQITIEFAAQQTGLSPRVVRRCIRWGLVSQTLSETELRELRRVRRLTSLGINLPGVDVILRMRRRIIALQAKIKQVETS